MKYFLFILIVISVSCTKKSPENEVVAENPEEIIESREIEFDKIDYDYPNETAETETIVFRLRGASGQKVKTRLYIRNKSSEDIDLIDFDTLNPSTFTVTRNRCRENFLKARRSCYIDLQVEYNSSVVDSAESVFFIQGKNVSEVNPSFSVVIDVNEEYVEAVNESGDALIKNKDVLNFGTLNPGESSNRRLYFYNTSKYVNVPAPTLPTFPAGVSVVLNKCTEDIKKLGSCYIDFKYDYQGLVDEQNLVNESVTLTSDNMGAANKILTFQALNLATPDPGAPKLILSETDYPETRVAGDKYVRRIYVSNSQGGTFSFNSSEFFTGDNLNVLSNTCLNNSLNAGEYCFADLEVSILADNDPVCFNATISSGNINKNYEKGNCQNFYNVTLNIVGDVGDVVSSDTDLSCESDCLTKNKEEIESLTNLSFDANNLEDQRYMFEKWTSDPQTNSCHDSTDLNCSFELTETIELTANFIPKVCSDVVTLVDYQTNFNSKALFNGNNVDEATISGDFINGCTYACLSGYVIDNDSANCVGAKHNITINLANTQENIGDITSNNTELSCETNCTTDSELIDENFSLEVSSNVEDLRYEFEKWQTIPVSNTCHNSTNALCSFNVLEETSLTASYLPRTCNDSNLQEYQIDFNSKPLFIMDNVDIVSITGDFVVGCDFSCDTGYEKNADDNCVQIEHDITIKLAENQENIGNITSNKLNLECIGSCTEDSESIIENDTLELIANNSDDLRYEFEKWSAEPNTNTCHDSTNILCSFSVVEDISITASYIPKVCNDGSSLSDYQVNFNGKSSFVLTNVLISSISGDYVNGCTYTCEEGYSVNPEGNCEESLAKYDDTFNYDTNGLNYVDYQGGDSTVDSFLQLDTSSDTDRDLIFDNSNDFPINSENLVIKETINKKFDALNKAIQDLKTEINNAQ